MYHIYKDLWNPNIGDTLLAKLESRNLHHPYAYYGTQRPCEKLMGYVIVCACDQEIDPFVNLFFTDCIQI